MPDTTPQHAVEIAFEAEPEPVAPIPQHVGLTPAQLRAAASVLAHVHSRPHFFAPPAGSGSSPSPA